MSKVLIRTPNHLGDCIMALPMISETREAYPASEISILVPESLKGIFINNPGIDKIIKIPTEHIHGLLSVIKVKDIISQENPDVGYILPPSFGAAASFKLAGVEKKIGYITDGRRLLLSKPIALPEPRNEVHRSELYFNLLLRGSGASLEFVSPKLFLNDNDISAGEKILSDFGIGKSDRFVVIAFRSVAESRRWGIEKYTRLIKELISSFGYKIILLGGKEDTLDGDQIAESAGIKEVLNLAGKTSIRESASVISFAEFFVGNDSGPAHLAAAVGTSLVVLSGADDPKETSPISKNKELIFLENMPCISCVSNKCDLKEESFMKCMKDISVEMVLDSIKKITL